MILVQGLMVLMLFFASDLCAGEVAEGSKLRDTILWGMDGETTTLSHYQGKPLLINVWASWCGPCRPEMDSIEQLAQNFQGREFNIIGISIDDDAEAAKALISAMKITFPNYLDFKLTLEDMLGAKNIPLTVLVSADGRIIKKIRGSRNWNSKEALQLLADEFQLDLGLQKPQ